MEWWGWLIIAFIYISARNDLNIIACTIKEIKKELEEIKFKL
jgi:hypothetical protein